MQRTIVECVEVRRGGLLIAAVQLTARQRDRSAQGGDVGPTCDWGEGRPPFPGSRSGRDRLAHGGVDATGPAGRAHGLVVGAGPGGAARLELHSR